MEWVAVLREGSSAFMVRSCGEKIVFGGGFWRVRLLDEVRVVSRTLQGAPAAQVRKIRDVRILAGGNVAVSDIVVESRAEIGVRLQSFSLLLFLSRLRGRGCASPRTRRTTARERTCASAAPRSPGPTSAVARSLALPTLARRFLCTNSPSLSRSTATSRNMRGRRGVMNASPKR